VYYGWEFALRITALMFVTMVIAALAVDGLFDVAGLVPDTRPDRDEIFSSIEFRGVSRSLSSGAQAIR
jgi:hypothetical protein